MTSRDLGLSTIIPLFLAEQNLLVTLVEYHRTIFIHLYEACSTTKEKFLQFQLEWHTNCSVLLLSKDLSVKTISSDIKEEDSHDMWQQFCKPHPPEIL